MQVSGLGTGALQTVSYIAAPDKMKNKGVLKANRRGNAMVYSIANFEVF
ncbi:MAG: hypothetical protein KAS13_07900 [Candidatus Omnitrophica bacterium]|nr:hypothetical protein [Candidatus Omnitrophota bacterium]